MFFKDRELSWDASEWFSLRFIIVSFLQLGSLARAKAKKEEISNFIRDAASHHVHHVDKKKEKKVAKKAAKAAPKAEEKK